MLETYRWEFINSPGSVYCVEFRSTGVIKALLNGNGNTPLKRDGPLISILH
jgi:hypothetical protein